MKTIKTPLTCCHL